MTKNNFKLFPKKSSELPASGFAKHPCIKFDLSSFAKFTILKEIVHKIKFNSVDGWETLPYMDCADTHTDIDHEPNFNAETVQDCIAFCHGFACFLSVNNFLNLTRGRKEIILFCEN